MGFLTGILGAVVKTALTPVAIVKDVVNVVAEVEPEATTTLLESAVEDTHDAIDDLSEGNFL